jgi:hypothetical protein
VASDERLNGKDLEGTGICVAEVYSGTSWEGLRMSVRIADVSAEIRTDHFRNTGYEQPARWVP